MKFPNIYGYIKWIILIFLWTKMDTIKEILDLHRYAYYPIPEESIEKIHQLLKNNVLFEVTYDIEYYYYGFYYMIRKNKEKAIYYLSKGMNSACFYALGSYYHSTPNIPEMKKYYIKAIVLGNENAMNNLGHYYLNKNHSKAVKYLKMAIVNGSIVAIQNLAIFYWDNRQYELALIYIKMGSEKNINWCHCLLGRYYRLIQFNEVLMIENYTSAIKQGHQNAFDELYDYYKHLQRLALSVQYPSFVKREKIIELFNRCLLLILSKEEEEVFFNILTTFEFNDDDQMSYGLILLCRTLNHHVDLMMLHFRYNMKGKGFKEAKEDYYKLIQNK